MAYVDLLAAICIVTNGSKGVSALQLARDLDCNPRTAFVFAHKLRQALAAEVKVFVADAACSSRSRWDTPIRSDGVGVGLAH